MKDNLTSVEILENKIRQAIIIPELLSRNVAVSTTGLGGVFVDFVSNSSNRLAVLNSKVQVKFYFDTCGSFGKYSGDDIGYDVETTRGCKERGIKVPRSIKKKAPYLQVVAKMNKWFEDNKLALYNCIENR